MLARLAAGLALLCAAVSAQDTGKKWPQVVGVGATPETLKAHHTDKFRLEDGFAIRRAATFELTVTTSEVLEHANMTIIMLNNDKRGKAYPRWKTSLKKKLGTKQYLINVTTTAEDPIGKYENVVFLVVEQDEKGHYEHTHEAYEYQYPFPIFVLFNPFSSEDKDVYVPHADILNDTLLNEYGKVFDGSLNEYRTIHWFYGHFARVALDAAFHILKKADQNILHDAYEVAKYISHNVGVAEVGDGLRGNKDGVLRGRWESTFPGGKDPDEWVSTYDILKKWEETGEPTKYGQCWVFAATQNTILRALGYASRQVSCFGARIDQSDQKDPHKKKHHIVREYYDDKARLVFNEGSVWNYHSWNDFWINRDDEAYSGWQGIDATPPGLAFASVQAVKEQLNDYPWHTEDFISTVHSRVERFLVKCRDEKEKRESLDGCRIIKRVSVDTKGVQLILTSAHGASGEKNITYDYVDPTRDAYIPEHHRRPWAEEIEQQQEKEETPFHVHVQPHIHRLPVGQPLRALIAVDIKTPVDGSPALDVSVAADLVDRMGRIVKEVHLRDGKMLVDSEGHGELTLQISPAEYVHIDMEEAYLELRAIVTDPATGHVVMEKGTVVMTGPEFSVMAPPLIAANGEDTHPVEVLLENPHPFPLERVCVTAHTSSHGLRVHGDRLHCMALGPNESVKVTKHIISPEEEGTHKLTLTVSGDYLPDTYHEIPILAAEPHTGLRAF